MSSKSICPILFIAVAGIALVGCADTASSTSASAQVVDNRHSHDGWWCDEHGVPEEICALCNVKLVADFKAKGDWCKEHERPDSQCFICHPEKEAEFAAQYEAKYGKKPPKPEGDEAAHGSKS
jgi:cobalt-zinc-cadmium efflux system membrane fusion protein